MRDTPEIWSRENPDRKKKRAPVRVEHRGHTYSEKKWSKLTLGEWNEVGKQLALALYIAPMTLLNAYNLATDPNTHEKLGARLSQLRDAIAQRLPDGYMVRKSETPDARTIIFTEKDMGPDQLPEIDFQIVIPDYEKKLVFEFRGIDLESLDWSGVPDPTKKDDARPGREKIGEWETSESPES